MWRLKWGKQVCGVRNGSAVREGLERDGESKVNKGRG